MSEIIYPYLKINHRENTGKGYKGKKIKNSSERK